MAVLIKNSSDIMGTEHSSNNWIIRVILNRNLALEDSKEDDQVTQKGSRVDLS